MMISTIKAYGQRRDTDWHQLLNCGARLFGDLFGSAEQLSRIKIMALNTEY